MIAHFQYLRSQQRWLLILLLILTSLLTLMPTMRLLIEALQGWELGNASPMMQVLQQPATWRALGHSLYTSGLGTLIAVVLGCLFAFTLTLTNIRGKSLLVFCFMLPMMIPPQVTALSWLQLTGPGSPLLNTLGIAPALGSPQPLYSAEGIALLLGIQHAPLVFLALRSSLIHLPRDLIEAARISGARQHKIWIDMILPLSRNGLIAGASIAFVSALGNFGIPAMLGIPASYYVLPTLIYQKMSGFGTSVLPEIASLSVLIGVLALMGVMMQQQMLKRSRFSLLGHSGRSQDFVLGRWRLPLEIVLALVLVLILVAPLVALVTSSLVPAMGVHLNFTNLSFTAYQEMVGRQGVTLRAFSNSLLLAGGAALLLMLLATLLAYLMQSLPQRARSALTSMIEIPYALPGVVLAIACILLFAKPIPILNLTLYGTLGIIFIAYLARFLSVSLKPIVASFSELDPSLEEAARISGASTLRRLVDILLPLIAPAIFAGGLLVFLTAVNELTVSALLWSAGKETLGVLIFNLDQSGDSILASAIAVLVVLMVAAIMLLLSLLAKHLPKGVIPWQN
ncbi:ABC transporter permease [Nitrincola iocasae]|uniref:Iron ABC transporter permease n=1 Tax=Nitrincola iocasae TaxID=2614693 RepID=A0A5J6LDW0_9GAMM|nr:iron ABC transporter permease [Nitrincola iocasae]QEW06462.1 iron ABC transporter permease [Nitrincola iocasae]